MMSKKNLGLILACVAACLMTIECAQSIAWDDDVEGQSFQTPEEEGIMRLCYEILGVEHNASPKDIDKAFKKLYRKYHPDKSLDDKNRANTITAALNRAKEILDNPKQALSDHQKRDNTNTTEEHDIQMLQAGINAKQALDRIRNVHANNNERRNLAPESEQPLDAINDVD